MTTFIYSLMTDRKKGIIFLPFKLVLYLSSLVYWIVIICRSLFYRFGIFKSNKVPIKIISVGNLTLGGTGKTPFVISLSRILNNELKSQVGVLIRGYGWDEQAMLKKNLADIPILVGEDRVKQAHRAIKLYGSDTAILDDGFQYWELQRDLDIVLVDSRNPFGNGHLFPRGILRETKAALKRADIVVFTKTDKKTHEPEEMKRTIRGINSEVIFLEAVHRPKHLYDVKGRKEAGLSFLEGKRVILISSIGDPGYFEDTARGLGADIAEHIAFGDHHDYTIYDMERIMKRCDERAFDLILTTEKDTVKISRMSLSFGKYPLMVLCVEMDITDGKEALVARLHSLYSS